MSADGGPAFPCDVFDPDVDGPEQHEGMSLRDWFAGKALVECIRVADHQTPGSNPKLGALFEKAATYAYFAADAMLKVRQK